MVPEIIAAFGSAGKKMDWDAPDTDGDAPLHLVL